jgi:predicted kinase
MVVVIFMCGPAGAGKSHLARELEAEGFVRLSSDRTAWERGIRAMPLPGDVEHDIEAELRGRLLALVAHGSDVVLDFSFHSRSMREMWRAVLAPLNVVPETLYLATPREVCLRRVAARRHGDADEFALDPELAATYFDHFEPPVPEEGPLRVMGTGNAAADDT